MPSIAPLKSRHKIPLPGALLEQWNGTYYFFYNNFNETKLYTNELLSFYVVSLYFTRQI